MMSPKRDKSTDCSVKNWQSTMTTKGPLLGSICPKNAALAKTIFLTGVCVAVNRDQWNDKLLPLKSAHFQLFYSKSLKMRF